MRPFLSALYETTMSWHLHHLYPIYFDRTLKSALSVLGGVGLIPGWGTKILHTKKKKKKSCSFSSHCHYPKSGFYYPLNYCSGLSNSFFHPKPYWATNAAGNNGFQYFTVPPKMVSGFLWPVAWTPWVGIQSPVHSGSKPIPHCWGNQASAALSLLSWLASLKGTKRQERKLAPGNMEIIKRYFQKIRHGWLIKNTGR